MRRATDVLSRYNRELAFRKADTGAVFHSALDEMAVNEVQMIYLLVKWSECLLGSDMDTRQKLTTYHRSGKLMMRPTHEQVRFAQKAMQR